MRRVDQAGLRARAAVLDLDAGEAVADFDVRGYASLWCLHRIEGVPIGTTFWDVSNEATVDLSALRDAAATLVPAGAEPPLPPTLPAGGADLTVAICTRDRTAELRRALLSLRAQSDGEFATIVVDNAPDRPGARGIVAEVAPEGSRYVGEPAPGLSRARNTALATVSTALVAWMDDDETADPRWVERLKQGFGHASRPVAVSGLMLPAELETEAQVRFEQYGGFNKGRGFRAEVLSTAAGTVRSPMYPLPSFGAGGNMAFRVDALREVGGFDPYLGAGTRTHGGEETRALALVLRAGGTVLHWPSAITWHYHRREMAELRDQFRGYSAGLSAFFMSMLITAPLASTREMARTLPTALAHIRPGRGNRRIGSLPADFPQELVRAGREGFAEGAGAYLRERRAHRRDSRER